MSSATKRRLRREKSSPSSQFELSLGSSPSGTRDSWRSGRSERQRSLSQSSASGGGSFGAARDPRFAHEDILGPLRTQMIARLHLIPASSVDSPGPDLGPTRSTARDTSYIRGGSPAPHDAVGRSQRASRQEVLAVPPRNLTISSTRPYMSSTRLQAPRSRATSLSSPPRPEVGGGNETARSSFTPPPSPRLSPLRYPGVNEDAVRGSVLFPSRTISSFSSRTISSPPYSPPPSSTSRRSSSSGDRSGSQSPSRFAWTPHTSDTESTSGSSGRSLSRERRDEIYPAGITEYALAYGGSRSVDRTVRSWSPRPLAPPGYLHSPQETNMSASVYSGAQQQSLAFPLSYPQEITNGWELESRGRSTRRSENTPGLTSRATPSSTSALGRPRSTSELYPPGLPENDERRKSGEFLLDVFRKIFEASGIDGNRPLRALRRNYLIVHAAPLEATIKTLPADLQRLKDVVATVQSRYRPAVNDGYIFQNADYRMSRSDSVAGEYRLHLERRMSTYWPCYTFIWLATAEPEARYSLSHGVLRRFRSVTKGSSASQYRAERRRAEQRCEKMRVKEDSTS